MPAKAISSPVTPLLARMDFDFSRYLTAKKTVDDRALNPLVWEAMAAAVCPTDPGRPLRVLEMGCGIGIMLERLLERGLGQAAPISAGLDYTGVDVDPASIALARRRIPGPPAHPALQSVTFIQADLSALPPALPPQAFDLLIAHAFLDLVDVPRALPILFSYLRKGGVFYFTLNFDGETIFQPEHRLDPLVVDLYHRTMDERRVQGRPSGDSRTGRHLFGHLRAAGVHLLAAGSSDWVVFPRAGGYPADEAYFLQHILHFFAQSLSGHPELDGEEFSGWLAERRGQVSRGELVYVAHQLDFAGRV